jgi:hypothetical protein
MPIVVILSSEGHEQADKKCKSPGLIMLTVPRFLNTSYNYFCLIFNICKVIQLNCFISPLTPSKCVYNKSPSPSIYE